MDNYNDNNINSNEEKAEKKSIRKLLIILGSIVIIVGLGILWFFGFLNIQYIWNSFACFVNTTYMEISKDERDIVPYWYTQDNNLAKPVIYLYPTEDIELNIKISNVDLTTTYPLYNNGWDVEVNKDGVILDKKGREYNYLYWEGVSSHFIDMSKGFIVSKDKYINFLEDKLEYIGLTDKEACDFISYWLPYMDKFDYCLVSFQMENYEEQVKLDFSIKPNNELRVFVAFKGLDEPIQIEEQDLSYYADFERSGFTVVEWGGTLLDNLDNNEMGYIDDTHIKNSNWWVYFEDKNVKTEEDLFKELESFKDGSESHNYNKYFKRIGNEFYIKDKGELLFLMQIEPNGIYVNLDIINNVKGSTLSKFFNYFIDWFFESNFDTETVEFCIKSWENMDNTFGAILLPIIYKSVGDTSYNPNYSSYKIWFVIFPLCFIIIYIGLFLSHKLLSKSIVLVDADNEGYFLDYFYKESENINNIFRFMLIFLFLFGVFLFFSNELIISEPIGGVVLIIALIVYGISFILFTLKSLSVTFLNNICKDKKIGKKNSRIILLFYIIWVFSPFLVLYLFF